jgi:hypothetical protein
VKGVLLALLALTGIVTIAAGERGTHPPALRHVKTFAYYGLNGTNAAVPPAVMAQHVDIVEDDGFTAEHAEAFKRAGGRIALAYTDPAYVPHCVPPFTPPAGACSGPIGDRLGGDESAFVHDAQGARIHRFGGEQFQYQEVLNVTRPAAWRAYARTTAAILQHAPRLDGFVADDSGSTLSYAGRERGSNFYYGFNAAGADIESDGAFIDGESGMLAAAGKPVIVNGGDPTTWGPAYGGRFLDLRAVMGQMFEGCFNNAGRYLYTDVDDKFRREENGLLAVIAHRKLALCFPTGDASPDHRLYAYASFLLSYDPAFSVFATNIPLADGLTLAPETQLVPFRPRTSASEIDRLRQGGVYVREFADCTIDGADVGACAAVVNPASKDEADLPSLAHGYAHRIALDDQSVLHGGKVRVVAGVPRRLAPASAAILVR